MVLNKDEVVEMTLNSDLEAKYRIGGQLHDAMQRIAVLETITGKHQADLGELKTMIIKLDNNILHQHAMYKLEMDSMRREVSRDNEALKNDLKHELGMQFAQHERRETEELAVRDNKSYELQRKIMGGVVVLVLSMLGALAYFLLERIQLG